MKTRSVDKNFSVYSIVQVRFPLAENQCSNDICREGFTVVVSKSLNASILKIISCNVCPVALIVIYLSRNYQRSGVPRYENRLKQATRDNFSLFLVRGRKRSPRVSNVLGSSHFGLRFAPALRCGGKRSEPFDLWFIARTFADFLRRPSPPPSSPQKCGEEMPFVACVCVR